MKKYDRRILLLKSIGILRRELKISCDKKKKYLAQEIKARKKLNELEDEAEKEFNFNDKLGIEIKD